MNNIKPLQELKEKLNNYFVIDKENNWINIDIININRLNLEAVTSRDESLDIYNEFIKKSIERYNKKVKNDEKIHTGFIDIWSIEEAEVMGIKKPEIKKEINNSSFGAIIDNKNNDLLKREKKTNLTKVISFYSYKGGVGRTVALIHTATLLAAEGKKVALIDMDIEAPSFNEIFKNEIKSKNGLVEYLYNKMYDLDDIQLSSMMTKLPLSTKGEVYILPTGEISSKYVKRLDKLKERRISENRYIEELISQMHTQYDVDYVLIDSRTGINNWGALSIGEIADEVFLLAYPNKENVRGTNLILDMLGENKKCTVVFSRIDGSEPGRKKAEKLFKEIKIKQEFIGIDYDSAIAIENRYPIEEKLNRFKKLSDIILEDEVNNNNRIWIKDNKEKVDDILNILSNKQRDENIFTNDEKKIIDKSNHIIIKDDNSNINLILEKYVKRKKLYKLINVDLKVLNNSELGLNQYSKKIDDVLYFTGMIASLLLINLEKEIHTDGDFDINDKFKFTMNYICNSYNKLDESTESFDEIIYRINKIFQKTYNELKKEKIFIYIDNSDIYDYSDKNIIALIIILKVINKYDNIQFKVFMDNEYYQNNRRMFAGSNPNVLSLVWEKSNSELMYENIKQVVDKKIEILNNIFFNKTIIKELKIDAMSLISYISEIEKLRSSEKQLTQDLIFFNKINVEGTTLDFIAWLVENFSNKVDILNIIMKAANIELKSNNYDKSSIITFDSFNKALEKIKKK